MKTSLTTFAFTALLSVLVGGLPSTAKAALVEPEPLGEGVLPSGQYVQEVKVTVHKGGLVPWHYHPGQTYVVVVAGTLTEEHGCGQPLETHVTGSAFSEPKRRIHQVYNSGDDDVVLIVTFIVPPKYAGYMANVYVNGPRCDDDHHD
jgi:quercetin dioxygenase-like cupin family protein